MTAQQENRQPEFYFTPVVRSLTVDDGLPQGNVNGLTQDKNGFIWISSDGISRFDGRNFLQFRHKTGDSSTLLGNTIDFIRMDHQYQLWIIHSSKEVDVLNTTNGRVRHISKEKKFNWLKKTLPDGYGTENYFIAQAGKFYYLANFTSLTAFDLQGTLRQEIALPKGENLLAIGENKEGVALMSTQKGLYEIHGNQLVSLIRFPAPSASAEEALRAGVQSHSRYPGTIFEAPTGMLVAPGIEYIYQFNRRTRALNAVYTGKNTAPWGVVPGKGYCYARSDKGYIRFDKNGVVTRLTTSAEIRFTDLALVDSTGLLWVATSNASGIRLFDMKAASFNSYPYTGGFLYDITQLLLPDRISPGYIFTSYSTRFAKDKNGKGWLLSNLFSVTDPAAAYWPGSGLYRLEDPTAWKFPLEWPNWHIMGVTFDEKNQCWLTLKFRDGPDAQLATVDMKTARIKKVANIPCIYAENHFLTSTGNKVFLLYEDHLKIYDTATGRFSLITKEQLKCDGILLMAMPDLHAKDILWIATKGSGIIRLNIESGEKQYFQESNGLPNNTVYYIASDKKGFFWCSSNKGIFRFDPTTGSSISFLEKDGLQGNEFNRYHFVETPDGHFIFGGTQGYSIFHPDSIYIDSFQTPVFVSGIAVNNLPLSQAAPELKDSLVSALQQLTLHFNQNFLNINFAGLQYNSPEKILYRYQLKGLDKEWVEAGTDANAKYAYLAPGKYTFMVNASNTSGIWSNRIREFHITILPPWWKTLWAYAGYLIFIALITYALYKNWLDRVRDKYRISSQQKEADQLKKMDEIKSRFFSNITHEFRTPLTLILAPVKQMQNDYQDPEINRKLNGVQRNAEQLLQLINQLLEMAKLESGSAQVVMRRGNILVFLQEIFDNFISYAEAKKIKFSKNLPDNLFSEHLFDADKLQKIVFNLLSNAIKFTEADGTVNITAVLSGSATNTDLLNLTIKDSGVGIAPDKLPLIFDRFYQVDDSRTRAYSGTGIGLALVRELAELMDGFVVAENNTDQSGMQFTLTLPLLKASGTKLTMTSGNIVLNESPLQRTTQEAPAANDATAGLKPLILVTEDHEDLNSFICQIFSNHCRVLSAKNGKEGWEIAQRELPELIISDLMMPEMDGLQFCKLVKTATVTSHIAFVLLTAKSSQESIREGLGNTADDYIRKPFDTEELKLRIHNLLARGKKLRDFYNKQLTSVNESLEPERSTDPFLLEIYRQVELHLDDAEFTVEKLAASVNVSTRTLVRKLNMLAEISPMDLVRQFRLKRAAEFLKQGKTVSEVAYSVGYDTRNYFSTAFKSFYGVTPSEYAKS